MRGKSNQQVSMLTLRTPEQMVPKDHPLRRVRALVDRLLVELSPTLDGMYSAHGRPSVPPERLLKAMLLIAFYSVRSERLCCEQLAYNMLFRWFLDMNLDEEPFDASTFSQNRDRLLEHDVGAKFFARVREQAKTLGLMSDEHFSVDGSLIDAWASLKSFRPKDERKRPPPDDPGNPTVNFHGEKRSNETHASTTDPDARLARKGHSKEAKLSYCANALMENRHGLVVSILVATATGRAEREAAISMLDETDNGHRRTLAADKAYDVRETVAACRTRNVTPHFAQNVNANGGSALDARTTRHPGYALSQRVRKRVEEIWGWMKTVGGFRKTRYRGLERTQLAAHLVASAYNLLRIGRLAPA